MEGKKKNRRRIVRRGTYEYLNEIAADLAYQQRVDQQAIDTYVRKRGIGFTQSLDWKEERW